MSTALQGGAPLGWGVSRRTDSLAAGHCGGHQPFPGDRAEDARVAHHAVVRDLQHEPKPDQAHINLLEEEGGDTTRTSEQAEPGFRLTKEHGKVLQ